MASGGHPCPSLSGQPQAPALPLSPRELKGGCWGLGDFSFLSGFLPIAVREAAAERTLFYTPASLNERACGKSLCPETGVYVSLGLGMVQSRRSRGCGSRAVRSPCSRRDRARFCRRQTFPASAADRIPSRAMRSQRKHPHLKLRQEHLVFLGAML